MYYDSFKETCVAMGLLQDNKDLILTLQEASQIQLGYQMRTLFAMLLAHCENVQTLELWEQFKDDLSDDLLRKLRLHHNDLTLPYNDEIYHESLRQIKDKVIRSKGIKFWRGLKLPIPTLSWPPNEKQLSDITFELNYDIQEEKEKTENTLKTLNIDQRQFYDKVMKQVQEVPDLLPPPSQVPQPPQPPQSPPPPPPRPKLPRMFSMY